jgi:hypothetical protein
MWASLTAANHGSESVQSNLQVDVLVLLDEYIVEQAQKTNAKEPAQQRESRGELFLPHQLRCRAGLREDNIAVLSIHPDRRSQRRPPPCR